MNQENYLNSFFTNFTRLLEQGLSEMCITLTSKPLILYMLDV